MRACALLVILLLGLAPAHGETIYLATCGGGIRALDAQHMTSTKLMSTSTCYFDIAAGKNGKLYVSDSYNLFVLDPAAGKSTFLGALGTFINGMTFVGETLYASGGSGFYRINPVNAQVQLVGDTGFTSSGDLQWFQGALYMTAGAGANDQLLRVDPATGHVTVVGDLGLPAVYGLAATSSTLLGLTGTGEVLAIDTSSGQATHLGSLGVSVYGASTLPSQVPEPGTLLLLGGGLWALGTKLRRR